MPAGGRLDLVGAQCPGLVDMNLLGSIVFCVSAVAGYISPVTGTLPNAERANLGTFVGAVCFLAGALLLLPERTETASGQVPVQDQVSRWIRPGSAGRKIRRVRHGCA